MNFPKLSFSGAIIKFIVCWLTVYSKHVLNAQVSIRTACCRRWIDCIECHNEIADHPLLKTSELTLICKKCRKAFRIQFDQTMDESDEYCPKYVCIIQIQVFESNWMLSFLPKVFIAYILTWQSCDNHFVIDAITKVEKPKAPISPKLDLRMLNQEEKELEELLDETTRLG